MKIGFYIVNQSIANVDCTDLVHGNPGIGGTQYSMFALVDYLCSNNIKDFDFILFANSIHNLPSSIHHLYQVDAFEQALFEAERLELDLLIFKHDSEYIKKGLFNRKNAPTNLKFIIWAHNFIRNPFLKFYARNESVSRIVNVSREQLDQYRDCLAFEKSVAIYNGVYMESFEEGTPFNERKNEVTYIGSIIPSKGFHILAMNWKNVLHRFPNARLNVIGSGNLYNRNQRLGKYGIAEESYEKEIIPYLTEENGELLASVVFHGVLGKEKNDILKRTKVGVPNPSGETETFGYTAVEMQGFGALVTTKKSIGYNETVFNSDHLYENEESLADVICRLLKTEYNGYKDTHEFIDANFHFNVVANQWLDLFARIKLAQGESVIPPFSDSLMIRMVEINRRIKSLIPAGHYVIPAVTDIVNSINRVKRLFSKHLKL